jgi:hypothetical protein
MRRQESGDEAFLFFRTTFTGKRAWGETENIFRGQMDDLS